ncbi:MAG: nicotinate-nicotinamide nucleotide adenylyltransferase [Candidatus Woesearchaeota archaeon]
MVVGVWGGSFDPVHTGHVLDVKALLATGLVQRIIISPAYKSFKGKTYHASYEHRVQMLKLTFKKMSNVEISDLEGKHRTGRTDTEKMIELKQLHPGEQLFWIQGSDAFLKDIESERFNEQKKTFKRIVVHRHGYDGAAIAKHRGVIYTLNDNRHKFSSTNFRSGTKDSHNQIPEDVRKYINDNQIY